MLLVMILITTMLLQTTIVYYNYNATSNNMHNDSAEVGAGILAESERLEREAIHIYMCIYIYV